MSSLQQPCPSILKRRYRSVLALNNIGVRLLELQCYSQAVASLQDSIDLMQSLLEQAGYILTKTTTANIRVDETGDAFVESAMQRLFAQPCPVDRAVLLLEVLTATQEGTLVNYRELLDKSNRTMTTYANSLQSVLQSAPSSYSAFPIRLEENLLVEEPTFLEHPACSEALRVAVVQQTSIITHNLAIAMFCCSKSSSTTECSNQLLESALRLSVLRSLEF